MNAPSPQTINALKNQLKQAFVGDDTVLDNLLIALLCQGHVLLEDAPGTGKTTLAKAIAKSLALSFKRIQCTPDLMPSDILGGNIYQPQSQDFKFIPGPVFTNLLLVDEINRAAPRTQSAFLEAMAEGTITIDRKTANLPKPFFVIATQNPVEFSGTFPLPEAQLDRFLMRLTLGRPNTEQALVILQNHSSSAQTAPVDSLQVIVTKEQLVQWQQASQSVTVDTQVQQYIVALIEASHHHKTIRLGASPRAAIALMHAAKAHAFIHEQDFVTPQHVQNIAHVILSHRLILSHQNTAEHAIKIVSELLQAVAVPGVARSPEQALNSTPQKNTALAPSNTQAAHSQPITSTASIPSVKTQPSVNNNSTQENGIEAIFNQRKAPSGVKKPRLQKNEPDQNQ